MATICAWTRRKFHCCRYITTRRQMAFAEASQMLPLSSAWFASKRFVPGESGADMNGLWRKMTASWYCRLSRDQQLLDDECAFRTYCNMITAGAMGISASSSESRHTCIAAGREFCQCRRSRIMFLAKVFASVIATCGPVYLINNRQDSQLGPKGKLSTNKNLDILRILVVNCAM